MQEDPLRLLGALVGTWTTEGSHPLLPDPVHGQATFEWLDGERFLIQRSRYEHPDIPDAIAITGVVDGRLAMHYFDVRGVFRVYEVDISRHAWRFWRDGPDFAQRFTGTFGDGGRTITGHGELAREGAGWEDDLALTYRRVQ